VTGSKTAGPNPYVGPRPFEVGEPLFGRDREVQRAPRTRLSGERIVLLHSPSGAGKSSLIQAGLIPRLRERFDVWRPTRVGHPLARGRRSRRKQSGTR
jgi:putative ribosome biogenesis GTPase RsgA